MALSFLVPHRTILLVADEALYVYACGPKGPRAVETVPWDSENFEDHVARIISKDCGSKPVLILNDMVEQHYRKERVPRGGVGFFDKAGMLKHKLRGAFPNYPVRAAFALKEKAPKAGSKGAADIYIFAAIPESKQLSQTMEAVNGSYASIAGFGLLPIEASDMVKALYTKLQKKGQARATQWVVFMGQHKHGGLRQIVIKNGELALTRMSPVMESDKDAEAWAGEVMQEFNATMSYLARFGFQQEDGLHIITIANPAGGEALQAMIEGAHSFSSLTTTDAAQILNLPLGTQDDYRFADPLHAAWAGRKPKLILPMRSTGIDQVSKPRRTALAAGFLMFCGAAFLGYQLIGAATDMSTVNSELEDANSKLAQLNVQYQKEAKRAEDLGLDFKLVKSSISIYEGLEKNNINPLTIYRDVGVALGKDTRIDKITVDGQKPLAPGTLPPAVDPAAPKPPLYQAVMEMTYPSTTDIDEGNKQVDDLKDRLQKILTGTSVEVTKRLKNYEYVQEMVVEAGASKKPDATQDFSAEITIKGPPLQ